jgi:poly(3-hydroxybutyrate) depolymerase
VKDNLRIEVYSTRNASEACLVRDVLQEAGVRAVVVDDLILAAGAQMPCARVCVPESDQDEARAIVQQWRHPAPAESASWTCSECGEEIDAQFDRCWNCSPNRLSDADEDQPTIVKRHRLAAAGVLIVIVLGVVAYLVPQPIAADIFPRETITVGDEVRAYRLVVPHSLPADPVPVVFAFHGVGDSIEAMAAHSGLDRLAAEEGFLLVYPAARNSMWETRDIDPLDLDSNPDVQFLDRLREQVGDQFRVDAERVYVVGMSNGASFAQVLASARPDIAAVVAHSGAKPIDLGDARRPFAILIVVGANDPAAVFMRSDADAYRRQGHETEVIVVPGLGHEWSRAHNPAMWEFLRQHKLERKD